MDCFRQVFRCFLYGSGPTALLLAILSSMAQADSLSIVYDVSQNQTAAVQQNAFTVVTFTGSVTNNTAAPITFQLTGGPQPFEPYVASFQNGIGYPGITLGAGQSTGTIDLAIVRLQFFDPSLTYPGTVNIVLQAINPGTGNVFTENDASIRVLSSVPEPSALVLLLCAFVGLAGAARNGLSPRSKSRRQ